MTRIVDGQGNIDLSLLLRRLRDGWVWIVLFTAVSSAGFVTVAFLATPLYRATAVLVVARSERTGLGSLTSALGQLGGLASFAGIDIGSGSAGIEESLAVLKSRAFTETFIRDNNLLPRILPERWDQRSGAWQGDEKTWPTLAQGFRRFDSQIRLVTNDNRTGLVRVQITLDDPADAARWANDLVERLNAEMRDRAIASTDASIRYLEQELERTANVDTRQAISRLMEAQVNQRMFANVTKEYAFRVVDRALPADLRDVVWPNKMMLLGLGVICGLLVGAGVALLTAPRPVSLT